MRIIQENEWKKIYICDSCNVVLEVIMEDLFIAILFNQLHNTKRKAVAFQCVKCNHIQPISWSSNLWGNLPTLKKWEALHPKQKDEE